MLSVNIVDLPAFCQILWDSSVAMICATPSSAGHG